MEYRSFNFSRVVSLSILNLPHKKSQTTDQVAKPAVFVRRPRIDGSISLAKKSLHNAVSKRLDHRRLFVATTIHVLDNRLSIPGTPDAIVGPDAMIKLTNMHPLRAVPAPVRSIVISIILFHSKSTSLDKKKGS